MKKFWKVFGKIAGILTAVIGVLFVVYFWNPVSYTHLTLPTIA